MEESNLAYADVDKALTLLNKKFGAGSVQRLGDNFTNYDIKVESTGSLLLDLALGKGGLPTGRIVELYGAQASGKTTLALLHIAEVQKSGRLAAFVDVEHALDPNLAQEYGVNIDDLIINQPSTGEEALEVAESLARTGEFGVIVIDSVSALLPSAESEAEMEQNSIGLQARLMSKALRKMTPVTSEGNCTIIFINQIREKVGVLYGNPEVTSGGRALAFYASIRIAVSQNGGNSGQIKDTAGVIIGHQIKCRIVKNKIATPYKEAIFNLQYGIGVDRQAEVADVAITAGIIKQGGAWFTYGEEGSPDYFKIQGRDNVRAYVKENQEFCNMLEQMLRGGQMPNE